MGKVIMVSDEVYEKLKSLKRPKESFSEVINRLIGKRLKLMDIAGSKTISIKDWKKVEKVFRKRDLIEALKTKEMLEKLEHEVSS